MHYPKIASRGLNMYELAGEKRLLSAMLLRAIADAIGTWNVCNNDIKETQRASGLRWLLRINEDPEPFSCHWVCRHLNISHPRLCRHIISNTSELEIVRRVAPAAYLLYGDLLGRSVPTYQRRPAEQLLLLHTHIKKNAA